MLAIFAFAIGDAAATVIVQLDLRGLVGRTDHIFIGTVTRVTSRWSKNRRHIVTDSVFRIERSIHGRQKTGTIVVRRLGGTVGKLGMRVAGSPVFQKGQRMLLFTELRGKHRYVVGMRQGVYRLHKDSRGRTKVYRRLSGLALAKRTPRGLVLGHKTSASSELLDTFVRRIQTTIKQCAKEKSRCRPR